MMGAMRANVPLWQPFLFKTFLLAMMENCSNIMLLLKLFYFKGDDALDNATEPSACSNDYHKVTRTAKKSLDLSASMYTSSTVKAIHKTVVINTKFCLLKNQQ
jgi:hypothetical protein